MFKIIMSEILISINIFFKQEDIFRAKILCLTKKHDYFIQYMIVINVYVETK